MTTLLYDYYLASIKDALEQTISRLKKLEEDK